MENLKMLPNDIANTVREIEYCLGLYDTKTTPDNHFYLDPSDSLLVYCRQLVKQVKELNNGT